MSPRIHRSLASTTAALTTRASLAGLAMVAVLAARPAAAGPNGGTVVGGAATIQGQGTGSVIINQSTQNAAINWNTFNIGTGETTTFNQPNSAAVALNRVIGGLGPSYLDGTLTANGRVFIVNGDGILFGPHSAITTAGFLATTNNIRDSDFMAGNYNFNIPGRPSSSIVNLGSITATNSGFAALVAPGVRNSGTITAQLGTVALAAGNAFTLDFYGDRLITLAVNDQIASAVKDVQTGRTLKSLVRNTGTLSANGGRVELTASAARAVVNSVINNKGVIEANSVGSRNGMIVLGAATGASKPAGAGVQTVKLAGRISVAGKDKGSKGGTVLVTGESIVLRGVTIDASGDAGGGQVLIGGGPQGTGNLAHAATVAMDAGTLINVNATGAGNGGKVVLWSDGLTTANGYITAQGGPLGGNGGTVETSGHTVDFSGIRVNTLAPQGATGTWLVDPTDLTLDATAAATISSDLSTTSVVLQTNLSGPPSGPPGTTGNTSGPGFGDIIVAGNISWSASTTLTLSAFHSITFNSVSSISNSGNGKLVLRADNTGVGNGFGTVTFATTNQVHFSSGTVSIYYDPASTFYASCPCYAPDYAHPTDFSSYVSGGQLTSYMLVNGAGDLTTIGRIVSGGSIAGNFALGRDFSAVGFTSVADATFTGLFDGYGGLGTTNYTISDLARSAPANSNDSYGGLFAFVGPTGIVRNLNLANVNITAGANSQFIGALAGNNSGTISNVAVLNGIVNGQTFSGIGAGGLVGQNNAGATITGSSANVAVTVGDATSGNQLNMAGGLVGTNSGTIASSSAAGAVSGGMVSLVGGLAGSNEGAITGSHAGGNVSLSVGTGNNIMFTSFAGGLVGQNGNGGNPPGIGTITSSYATGTVTGSGLGLAVGGLVGDNSPGSTITDSQAFGAVSANTPGTTGSNNNSNNNNSAGGLVGSNQGTITSSTTPAFALAATCTQGAAFSCAQGAVSIGALGSAGGLVGGNQGTIQFALATGQVTGAAGSPPDPGHGHDHDTTLGGLAGSNQGMITGSVATGAVGGPGIQYLNVGGLAGDNSGTIKVSFAYGNVVAGDNSFAGGLTGDNAPSNDNGCNSCTPGTGQNNAGLIQLAAAFGNVTVGASSFAGGLSATGGGTFITDLAFGNVGGGANSTLGGLVGAVGVGSGPGLISASFATGGVAATGPNSIVGGLVGLSAGAITESAASGPVSGTSDSYLGGLVGINLGLVQNSVSISTVTGSGSHDVAGGLVGLNFGSIDPSLSSGNVAAGPNSIVGGLVGANAAFSNFSAGFFPGSGFPIGSISSDSLASGAASGGPGSTVGPQVGLNFPTSGLPGFPTAGGCNNDICGTLSAGILFDPNAGPTPPPLSSALSQALVIQNLTDYPITLASLTPDDVVSIQGLNQPPPGPRPRQGPGTSPQDFGTGRFFVVPPLTETSLVKDEAVLQMPCNIDAGELKLIMRQAGLTVLSSQCLPLLGMASYRVHIEHGRSMAVVFRELARHQIVAGAQANYVYTLMQDPAQDPDLAGRTQGEGDAAQYALSKLGLFDIHRLIKGTNISIAVIDSQIDLKHPDLEGVFAGQYDAVGGAEEKPHPHGTGMAGAIAAHRRLMGIAPAARLYAIHAFSSSAASAESTTFSILKGLDWAASKGVRVINMSFAGPRDPSMERALKNAHDKGIVLIAAAGNAGPKSPPLYPGADPSVIAVTATDANDKVFAGANRGKYIAVAAPGVDILVPAPDDTFQLTTGTSVSSAEVAGIAALLLERNPNLTPEDIRKILTSSAKHPGAKERDDDFGSGLVDPAKALQDAGDFKTIQPAKR